MSRVFHFSSMILQHTPVRTGNRQVDSFHFSFFICLCIWKRGLCWTFIHVWCCLIRISVLFNILCVLISFLLLVTQCCSVSAAQSRCIGLGTGRHAGLWYALKCSTLHPAICEKPRSGYSPLPTQPLVPPSARCPQQWYETRLSCFQVGSVLYCFAGLLVSLAVVFPAVVWDLLLLLPVVFCALLLCWFASFSSCSIPSSGMRLATPACRWVLCFTGLLAAVAVAFPAEYSWGHPVYTMVHCTDAFHRVRGLRVWPFFLLPCILGSHTRSLEDLSPFLEDGCCHARSLSWLKIVPT